MLLSCRRVARQLALLLCAGAMAIVVATPATAQPVVVIHRNRDVAPAGGIGRLVADALGLGGAAAVERTVLYEVDVAGEVASELEGFRRTVAATLRDPRGWSDDGRILYVPVRSGGEVRIVLASPAVIDDANPTCSARYSCRVGDDVYINDRRWRSGALTYRNRPLPEYRQYVINHEFGHWLGLGHRDCEDAGASAWVMQQQTISLDGCVSRVWPHREESATAARKLGLR